MHGQHRVRTEYVLFLRSASHKQTRILWYQLLAVIRNCASQCSSKLQAVLLMKVKVFLVQTIKEFGEGGWYK